MQNLIVLCHRCCAWVETHSESCLGCGSDVVLDYPDPGRDELARVLGRPISVMGPLRIDRRSLPSFGFLVGTSDGIVFLPRLHRRLNGALEGIDSQNNPGWWPFRGDRKSPRFWSWLRNPFEVGTQVESTSAPPVEDETESLVERLMDSPGAFFVGLNTILSVSARRRRIKLERAACRSITMIDETEDGSLLVSLNSHVARASTEKLRPAL